MGFPAGLGKGRSSENQLSDNCTYRVAGVSTNHLIYLELQSCQQITALLSTDGGQRKRKDDGELEEKPSKRKSVGNEDCPVPGGDGRVDVPASALQKLQLAIDPPEVQQNTAPGTTTTNYHIYHDFLTVHTG